MIRKLILIMLLFVVSMKSSAVEKTYSHTFSTHTYIPVGASLSLSTIDWSFNWKPTSASTNNSFQTDYGQGFGSTSKPMEDLKLSTNDIPGTIKKVIVHTAGTNASTKAKLAVTVNGITYGRTTSLVKTTQALEFIPITPQEGSIVLRWTQTSEYCICVSQITVVYDDNTAIEQPNAPTLTPSTDFTESITVQASCEEGLTLRYTTGDEQPSATSAIWPSEGLTLTATTKVNIVAVNSDGVLSDVVSSTYTKNEPTLQVPEFKWSTTDYCVTLGSAYTLPQLTNQSDGTVTYSSSNENVATISETGEVTILTAGTTEIAASVSATDIYSEATAKYTLTVNEEVINTNYALVCFDPNNQAYAMTSIYYSSAKNSLKAAIVNIVNHKVVYSGTDNIIWDCDTVKGYFKANGNYLSGNSENTNLTLNGSKCKWTFNTTKQAWCIGNRTFTCDYTSNYFKNFSTSKLSSSGYCGPTKPMPISDGYARTVTKGNYGTICLPYAVSAQDHVGARYYSIAGVKKVDGVASQLVLKPENELNAGQPYIFLADSSVITLAYHGDMVSTSSEFNGLKGVLVASDVAEGSYVLSNNKILKCGSGCTAAANRAYIDLNGVSEYNQVLEANMCVINFEQEITAVKNTTKSNPLSLVDVYAVNGSLLLKNVKYSELRNKLPSGCYVVNNKMIKIK